MAQVRAEEAGAASLTALDQNGYVRVIYPFGTPSADIAADIKALLNQ